MSYLLSISLGPVQDFIAAARRTADLYAGSQILQELSKHAAQFLHNNGAQLIFPADQNADGANKILAEVKDDPKQLAAETKKAVQESLLRLWEEAKSKLPSEYRNLIDQARAQEQLGRFLEFYAAWVPLNGDYPEARQAVERLLAGRKALRDFAPTQQHDAGVPKSPLDPSWAAVIDPRQWANASVRLADGSHRPLRIKPTEISLLLEEMPDGYTVLSPLGQAYLEAFRGELEQAQTTPIYLAPKAKRTWEGLEPATKERYRKLLERLRLPNRAASSELKSGGGDALGFPKGRTDERVFYAEKDGALYVFALTHHSPEYERMCQVGFYWRDYSPQDFTLLDE